MILSFNDCFLAAKAIADKVKCASGSYTGVYGIPRGGLIPAAMVAYHLNVPLVSYFRDCDNILIVDDTTLTGRTLRKYKQDTAVLTCHGRNDYKCKYYGILNNGYVTFEWETKI